MPLGVYVIDANFVLTATAEGFLNAHSTAIFTPEATELDPWEREHDPFAGEKKDGFGFTSVITASTADVAPRGQREDLEEPQEAAGEGRRRSGRSRRKLPRARSAARYRPTPAPAANVHMYERRPSPAEACIRGGRFATCLQIESTTRTRHRVGVVAFRRKRGPGSIELGAVR